MFIGCGKRKPPLPPVERVVQRADISGEQQGDRVIISWTMPARNATDTSLLNIERVDIYRLIEPLDSELSLAEEDFASRSTLIGSVPVAADDFALKQLSYIDRLSFAGQPARIRYAVRFVNSSGQKAAFSNFLVLEPSAKIAKAPTALSGEVTQERIVLEWTAPASNIDNSTPVSVLGYNVYRVSSEGESVKKLNESPVSQNSFADEFFEFGKTYEYFVRSVSVGAGAQPVESLDSEIVRITPKDVFPPAAPTALTIAASPGVISVFFATSIEKDIVGYHIHRSTDRSLPKDRWSKVNSEIWKINTFQDKTVEPGVRYFYYVTAEDKFGNTSPASEIVSETAL